MKSRYKLSDKVRKQRIRDWICLFLSITVFVLGFVWGMFDPSEPMEKGIICFAGIVLIEQFRCV